MFLAYFIRISNPDKKTKRFYKIFLTSIYLHTRHQTMKKKQKKKTVLPSKEYN